MEQENSFEMFEDTDGDENDFLVGSASSSKRLINLATTVETILRGILSYGTHNDDQKSTASNGGRSLSSQKSKQFKDFDMIN